MWGPTLGMLLGSPYLEGHEDSASKLTMGIIEVIILLIGLLTYVLSPHDPPSIVRMRSCKHMSRDDSGMFARACK